MVCSIGMIPGGKLFIYLKIVSEFWNIPTTDSSFFLSSKNNNKHHTSNDVSSPERQTRVHVITPFQILRKAIFSSRHLFSLIRTLFSSYLVQEPLLELDKQQLDYLQNVEAIWYE